MKKGWQIVFTIVMIVILIGGVSFGVGMITGAQFNRIYSVLDSQYSLGIYYEYITQELIPAFQSAGIF